MLKRMNFGWIIWSGIFLLFGLFSISSKNTAYLGIISLVISAIFVIVGIKNCIQTAKENKRIEEKYRGLVFRTNCIHCGYFIEADLHSFQPHRNYPEGFVYCPVCKKPVSKNAFHTEPDDS